ncbi:MAG: response regulator transcription factor [Clostridiales bacterium]|mgnify:CR=1 FL=1|jgi:DNA-binding response OmpR family regulator|nr:response regulator transcription factor [Clostridiales bacterium]
MAETILVCDDDREIAAAIDIYLTAEGYKVIQAYDGLGALEALESNQEIKLILMDIMMPRLDGVRATMKIRETRNIPIIMLSARSEDNDKILGLNIGADDYITKPFNPLELIARVRSQLRRYSGYGTAKSENADDSVIVNGGLEINDAAKSVTVDGQEVSLTPVEYKIVRFLMENRGRVFSSAQIYESVWNEPSYGADNIVAVHIRHIREKIEINPKEPRYIKVIWGHGYKMEKIED